MDFTRQNVSQLAPSLTNTKVKIWGPKPSEMSENQKSFLNQHRRFGIVFGSIGGSDDVKMCVRRNTHENRRLIRENFFLKK